MKKSTTIGTIVFLGIIVGIVGLYAFLSGKSRNRDMDVSMTEGSGQVFCGDPEMHL